MAPAPNPTAMEAADHPALLDMIVPPPPPAKQVSPAGSSDGSDAAAERTAMLRAAERKLSPVIVIGAFLTIFINYIDLTNLSFG